MAIGDFINRFRQKREKGVDHDVEEQYDEDGKPKYEFGNGLPDFLDPKDKKAAENRAEFKKFVGKTDKTFLPKVENILTGTDIDKLSKDDFDLFTGFVAEFQEKWEMANKLSEKVTDDMVEQMAKNSNRGAFGTIVYAYGVDTMGKIWRENMTRLIVNDEAKFESLQGALNEYEKKTRLGDYIIKTEAGRLGIKEAKYEDIMAEPDDQLRREKLRAVLDAKYDKPKNKWGKFWSYASREAKKIAEKGREELENTLAAMDEQIAAIAELLADATSDNKEIQQAVYAAIKA